MILAERLSHLRCIADAQGRSPLGGSGSPLLGGFGLVRCLSLAECQKDNRLPKIVNHFL